MQSITRFAAATRDILAISSTAESQWSAIARQLPSLLNDPELRARASVWTDTHGNGYTTTTNLLLYEDPLYGFVINSLVKAHGGEVRPHDHAHTWTAYGVIEGTERIVRYRLSQGDRYGKQARLERTRDTLVHPGYVDLIGPYETHAENAESGRTVAIIVRSQRTGRALHAIYDLSSGTVERRPGPAQVPTRFD